MTTSPATRKRKHAGAETFHIERTILEPITIEDPEHDLIELSTAADILGVGRPTVSNLVDRGTLATVRRSGSSRRWVLRREVEGLAASRRGA